MSHRISVSLVFAGAAFALVACAHEPPAPPQHPVATIPIPPKLIDRSIGTATMLSDGTIVMELRTSLDGGPGHMTQKLKPNDLQYAQLLKQLGGLKPGQSKPLTDYPGQ